MPSELTLPAVPPNDRPDLNPEDSSSSIAQVWNSKKSSTKFGIQWREIGSPSKCSEMRFSKIRDDGRPPSWISILGHNFESTSINIFAQNLVPWWKISRLMRCIGQKSAFKKIQHGGREPSGKSKSYYNSVVDWDIFMKFCMMVEFTSIMSAIC